MTQAEIEHIWKKERLESQLGITMGISILLFALMTGYFIMTVSNIWFRIGITSIAGILCLHQKRCKRGQ